MTQQGWQCPVCNFVYSPITPCCYNCNRPEHEKFKTTTEVDIFNYTFTKSKCKCLTRIRQTSNTCLNCGGIIE